MYQVLLSSMLQLTSYVLDIDVTRNGNNLKLKVKFKIFLTYGLNADKP